MMQSLLQNILPFELPKNLPDASSRKLYNQWDIPARQIQISAITFLTALLYIIFGIVEKPWAPEQAQVLMLKLHLFVVAPMLLIISFLAYKKRFYNFVLPTLAITPVIAMSCHAYILTKLGDYTPFLSEGYLSVLWTFVVSGITFRYAIVSASMSLVILITSGFFIINDPGVYTMHVFWVLCSFSFGFLGALIFDRSRKAVFISQMELQHLAITDELTGAFNRNHLNDVLQQEIARSLRYDKSFGVLIIDIDHFKNINDTYGHTAGDKVIQKVSQVLSKYKRSNDTLVRWGGEEFIVIAIEVNEQTLMDLCEKLRTKIENDSYAATEKVTVSIGATLIRKDDTQDSLVLRADKALYEAKGKGRNVSVSN